MFNMLVSKTRATSPGTRRPRLEPRSTHLDDVIINALCPDRGGLLVASPLHHPVRTRRP